MTGKVVGFILCIWFVMMLLTGIYSSSSVTGSGAYWAFGNNNNPNGSDAGFQSGQTPTNDISYLLGVLNVNEHASIGAISIPFPNQQWFATLFRVITLQASFFTDTSSGLNLMIFWWFPCLEIAILGIYTMITVFMNVLQGL
jgi:hypothetical protein